MQSGHKIFKVSCHGRREYFKHQPRYRGFIADTRSARIPAEYMRSSERRTAAALRLAMNKCEMHSESDSLFQRKEALALKTFNIPCETAVNL